MTYYKRVAEVYLVFPECVAVHLDSWRETKETGAA